MNKTDQRELINQQPIGMAELTAEKGNYLFFNTKELIFRDLSHDELQVVSIFDLFDGENRERLKGLFKQCVVSSTKQTYFFDYKKGSRYFQMGLVKSHNGNIISSLTDITNLRTLEAQQLVDEDNIKCLSDAVAGANIGCWDYYPQEDRIIANETWVTQKKYNDEDFRVNTKLFSDVIDGLTKWASIVHPDDLEATNKLIEEHLNGETDVYDAKFRVKCGDNEWRWIHDIGRVFLRDKNGAAIRMNGVHIDITERKQAEENLERIAHFDLLTNLPNRILLADRLSHSMAQCQRRNQSLAVVFMDLDGFKAVNDNHGHNVGDELLIAVSKRMNAALREGDTLARIGGDEFIAVIIDLENIEDSQPVLNRLLKAASDPVTLGDHVMHVSASIGVTLYPRDGADAGQLMRHADQAMYVAKQAGKNRYHLFDITQENASKTQGKGVGDIRLALDRCEFRLHYQPKVNMRTGEVIGVEALIRWQHPVNGLMPSLAFLPLIEHHAISLEVGEWVIGNALRQIIQWRSAAINLPISVNISAYQLQQDDFASRLAAVLAAYPDVSPDCLELEILETSVLSNISRVSATMNACHNLGVLFALDDFGTGYSSLNHLRHLPAQLIKIDQSFVRGILKDADDLAIVKGVVGLAKAFQRDVIAEGVETVAHGTALLQLGCELAQGYGIARPMPAGDIPKWVSNWKADDSWQA
ncbi:MAG: diguanylate cyclase (GGDEF)-like protein [Alphaproteobacteria bacterium]|jgi:diguanylate cyclase (GGDEF)-like protein